MTGASGFENSANTLFLQSTLMERYIAAAERIVELTLPKEPKTASHFLTRTMILIAKPGETTTEREAAEKTLKKIIKRAFRQPASDRETDQVLELYFKFRRRGNDFEASVKQIIQGLLISPKFLFRVEQGNPTAESFQVSDWELASRLSYFLWASMPDSELFELAEKGTLHEPSVLSQQTERMLKNPKAESLGRVFAAQWLGFRLIGTRIRLDPIDNPWCTDSLMTAMRDESAMFFNSLIREDRRIANLVDADYSFINEELAQEIYELEDVLGTRMRRVTMRNPGRGGILTHASLMAVTSNHKETSPIKRGNWILETLLGLPFPPPPPNAGVFKEEVAENDSLTFREKVELHSSDPSCRSCHSKIDPLGFSLENLDYFGRWRESYRVRINEKVKESPPKRRRRYEVKPVDANATLPDGTPFNGPAGLKTVIIEKHHADLVRQVVSKLLAYGLGRQLEYYDEPAIRRILTDLEKDDFHFQALLKRIVNSYPFQYKKNQITHSVK
jgi:hypothetical protein